LSTVGSAVLSERDDLPSKRYTDILAETAPLDAAARRAKQGLVGRQLTLR